MRCSALVLVLALAGCSLDIARLYGAPTADAGVDATTDLDAQADAATGLDAQADAASSNDASTLDAVEPGDAAADAGPPMLALRSDYEVSTSAQPVPTSLAAGTGGGETRVAVSVGPLGLTRILHVEGSGCSLALVERDPPYSPRFPGPVAIGQVDAEGRPDVIIATDTALATVTGSEPTPVLSSAHGLGSLTAIDVGQFDDDGDLDVLAVGPGGRALLLLGEPSDVTFSGSLAADTASATFMDGAFVRFPGDAFLDFVIIAAAAGPTVTSVGYLGDGTGARTPAVSAMLSAGSARLADGALDRGAEQVFIVGGRTLHVMSDRTVVRDHPLDIDATDVALAELDGAFPRELVVSSATDRSISLYHLEGSALTLAARVTVADQPTELAVANPDGGADELLVLVGRRASLMSIRSCP